MVVLCAGLAAAPAGAAERASIPAWPSGLAAAARVWIGELMGLWMPAPHGLTAVRGNEDTSSTTPPPDADQLKQHVDNPGQTPMK
jgi:hypothetical protein